MEGPVKITFDAIVAAVAAEAGLPVARLRGRPPRGNGANGRPYRRMLLLARRLRPDLSLALLGRLTGGRTERAVLDSIDTAERLYAECRLERAAVEAVLARLGLTELPAGGPAAARLQRVIREIGWAEARLADLRARKAELEASL